MDELKSVYRRLDLEVEHSRDVLSTQMQYYRTHTAELAETNTLIEQIRHLQTVLTLSTRNADINEATRNTNVLTESKEAYDRRRERLTRIESVSKEIESRKRQLKNELDAIKESDALEVAKNEQKLKLYERYMGLKVQRSDNMLTLEFASLPPVYVIVSNGKPEYIKCGAKVAKVNSGTFAQVACLARKFAQDVKTHANDY